MEYSPQEGERAYSSWASELPSTGDFHRLPAFYIPHCCVLAVGRGGDTFILGSQIFRRFFLTPCSGIEELHAAGPHLGLRFVTRPCALCPGLRP